MAEYIKVRLDIRNGMSFLYLEIVKQAQKDSWKRNAVQ